MREIFPALIWLLITAIVAASGVVYGVVVYPGEPLVIGAVFAVLVGMPILAFERKVFLRTLHRRLQKLPAVAFIISVLVIYEILMSIGYALAGLLLSALGLLKPSSMADVLIMPFNVFLYALAVCAVIVFVLRVRELLGRDVFTQHADQPLPQSGQGGARLPLHRPRQFDLLRREAWRPSCAAIAELPVCRFRRTGATQQGRDRRLCRRCRDRHVAARARTQGCAAAYAASSTSSTDIEADAGSWLKQYGQVPRLRAALHGGFVITAEIGVDHHKITYFGDTVNTTARLEGLCKTLNRPVLISSELAQRMTLPEMIDIEDLASMRSRAAARDWASWRWSRALPASDASPKLHPDRQFGVINALLSETANSLLWGFMKTALFTSVSLSFLIATFAYADSRPFRPSSPAMRSCLPTPSSRLRPMPRPS